LNFGRNGFIKSTTGEDAAAGWTRGKLVLKPRGMKSGPKKFRATLQLQVGQKNALG
jgi:hypothetical protein